MNEPGWGTQADYGWNPGAHWGVLAVGKGGWKGTGKSYGTAKGGWNGGKGFGKTDSSRPFPPKGFGKGGKADGGKAKGAPFRGNCFLCGLKGHGKGQCPSVGKGFAGECWECGVKGHSAARCPTVHEITEGIYPDEGEEDGGANADKGEMTCESIFVNAVAAEDGWKEVANLRGSWRKIVAKVDSGAQKSVIDKKTAPKTKLLEGLPSKTLKAANNSQIKTFGEQMLKGTTDTGLDLDIQPTVAEVTGPLWSVIEMVDQGKNVVFSPSASYIEDVKTGAWAPIVRRGRSFEFTMWIKDDPSVNAVGQGKAKDGPSQQTSNANVVKKTPLTKPTTTSKSVFARLGALM